ncbi:glycoside hydrolase family 140 protein [Cecembia rubra]|uniref:glycoside hydrolase family 140 protein n=1 Tax=Cecembia rubra TaxID=1485585 RepID=UPI0027145399|nr:glycoside hydrolase family 140 protein [Cecembia rubra]
MDKFIISFFLLILISYPSTGQVEGPIRISDNQRYFQNPDGTPFFWMADTAWELFHRTTREEAKYYLETRAMQGFNVVQAVALAELDGLNTPNSYGNTPFLSLNPFEYNEKYWEYIDEIIDLAEEKGIHIALLPTWGDKLFKNTWGEGPEIFNEKNAYQFGNWLGKRLANKKNLIWVIGGDRNPRKDSNDKEIWNLMAKGIKDTAKPDNPILMTFHPQPNWPAGSSTWFHEERWLDFNMQQTGHCPNQPTFRIIEHDYQLLPLKPTLDGEPLYEEHPNCFNAKELGYSNPDDIRRIMYWNVFAGAAGQTYGCHAVWQMFTLERKPINGPLKPWQVSLDLPMANQVKHLKKLMLSQSYFTRIPDFSIVLDQQEDDENFVIATRDLNHTFLMVYFPTGKSVNLDLSSFSEIMQAKWFDPRTGVSFDYSGTPLRNENIRINPPSSGKGNDWVLVVSRQ